MSIEPATSDSGGSRATAAEGQELAGYESILCEELRVVVSLIELALAIERA